MSAVDGSVAAAAALFWLATTYKVVELRRRPAPAQRSLTLTMASLALAATFLIPSVHLLAGRITGVANVAEPIARTAVLVAACSAQALLLRSTANDGRARWAVGLRSLLAAVALVALWGLFAAAPVGTSTLRFTSRYGTEPLVMAYLVVALGYLGWALLDIRRGSRRYSVEASGFLASGLRLIGWGCLVGLAYIGVKVLAVVGLAVGSPIPVEVESTVGRMTAVIAGTLVLVGSTLPASGPLVRSWMAWFAAYRDHRQLYALWADLVSVTPDIALDPAGSRLRDALLLRDLDLRVYRRVIEIRDGRLALRSYLDADIEGDVLLEPGEAAARSAAVSEASLLHAAVASARVGRLPAARALGLGSAGDSFADELRWFLLVSRHYRRLRRESHAMWTPQARGTAVRAS